MEPLKISKAHWSYRLISFAFGASSTEEWSRYYTIDSCKYNRKLFWASAWVMVATLIAMWYGAAFTVSAILVTLTALNTNIPWHEILRFVARDIRDTYGAVFEIHFILIFASVFIPFCVSIIFGLGWVCFKGIDWINRNKPKPSPSKTKELYTAWKEKYCVPVKFE